MDVKHLQYIIAIAEEGNMTKAAERLYVSQSSLSYYLSKLEQEIGTALFLRTANKLLPTAAGKLYLESAREVVGIKERLYQNLSNMDNKSLIRIATTSLWGNRMLADIIPRFKRTFPDVVFKLYHLDLLPLRKEVLTGNVDFGLMSVGTKNEIDDTAELLRDEELLFAVPARHPYVKKNPGDCIAQKELATVFYEDNFLLSQPTSANRYLADQLFDTYLRSTPPHVCEVTGLPLTCDMIAEGIGVSFIPVSGKCMEHKIHYYSCSPKLYRYNILVHRKNLVLNQPEQAFFDYVKNYFPGKKQG